MIWGLFDKKKSGAQEAEAERRGLFDGLRKSSSRLGQSFAAVFTKDKLDASALEALEEALIGSDMGAPAAHRIAQALADKRFGRDNPNEAREALADEVARVLKPREAHLD